MGDESPNAHESKSMIGLVPSAQQLTLQSSKVQNTVFSPIELDPNKTFFTNRTRIFKKIKSGFSLFH